MNTIVVILAAGKGKRMFSQTAKVLHTLSGTSLINHVIEKAKALNPSKIIIVVGHQADQVIEHTKHLEVIHVIQNKQLGTGHAVSQALQHIETNSRVLIMCGDMPLIFVETLDRLANVTDENEIAWLFSDVVNAHGFGRLVRDQNFCPVGIVEERDATESEKAIREVNTGVCSIPAKLLIEWLPLIDNCNQQKEYYLTDIFKMALERKINVNIIKTIDSNEILGVNSKIDLEIAERAIQQKQAEELMSRGLNLSDKNRFDLRGELQFGSDVKIDVNVVIEGKVVIGNNCSIGPNVILRDVVIGNDVVIHPFTMIDGSQIGNNCQVGPFARIRPKTILNDKAKIGNFVEIKKSNVGTGSKISHLSYVGDTEVGRNVNIGAGTITCNYDGVNKYKTVIEDDVFIGSATQLIAPVVIGLGATIGAGSTIVKDVPPEKLTLSRAKQVTLDKWKRKN